MSRTSITPFLRGRWFWARVPRLGLPGIQRPLGTADRSVAESVCSFLRVLRERRESFLLDAIVDGKVTIGAAFDAYRENRLETFIAETREGRRDEDLEPYVAKWQRELERRRNPSAESRAKYLKQVRTFIPEGERFPRSRLTPKSIKAWLAGLDVHAPNRYRAALSSFASFLVEEEVVPFNPVAQVKATKEAEPRCRYLDQVEARKLIDALAGTARVYHALAMATGLERQAMGRLRRRDVDLERMTVLARATKKAHRARTVTVYDRWLWAWTIFARDLERRALLPDALVFADASLDTYYRVLMAACKAIGVEDYHPHDHRHTWAVQALRDGLAIQTVASQLGHRDAVMTLRVYGRFIPTSADYAPRPGPRPATYSATSTMSLVRMEGA